MLTLWSVARTLVVSCVLGDMLCGGEKVSLHKVLNFLGVTHCHYTLRGALQEVQFCVIGSSQALWQRCFLFPQWFLDGQEQCSDAWTALRRWWPQVHRGGRGLQLR